MMKLADMRDLGSRALRRWGSSPHARTKNKTICLWQMVLFLGSAPCGRSTPRGSNMPGASELPLCKCFCTAKAFYGAKAPRGTEWVGVPAPIGGAQHCCRGAAMRDGVLRRLRLRGALALSGNSRWGAVLMMMNAAPIDSAGQNTMIIFRQRYRLWATRVCLGRSECR